MTQLKCWIVIGLSLAQWRYLLRRGHLKVLKVMGYVSITSWGEVLPVSLSARVTVFPTAASVAARRGIINRRKMCKRCIM